MVTGVVYMVRCADGKYYVGSHRGDDVMNRVNDHNNGLYPNAFTYTRRPVELVWNEYFSDMRDMVACERRLKGWTRAKKEAVIRGDVDMLKTLAKRKSVRDGVLHGNKSKPHPEVPAQRASKDEAEARKK